MTTWALTLPLIIIFTAAMVGLAFGLPALNRRLTTTQLAWVLALAPASAFGLILSWLPAIGDGQPLTTTWEWLPAMGLSLGLYLDNLSALFALLVTGIGALVVIYAGYYFKGDQTAWRFLGYILIFMTAMLGLVTAGDILTLFIFWEGTSITSFLLVAYKYKYEDARRGAFKALFITGGGGIVLLAGLLFVAAVAGGSDWATILSSGDVLREHPYYLAMLLLVTFGAFTKSAQAPAHIWLPSAMSAPTPASAYLHSATMVKAGIYLMARVNPALGQTETWFWLLSIAGLLSMLTGAYLGVKQNDLKALLAYSTVSQLGILMMLIGQDTEIAFKALIIGVVAHALYKSALFLLAGIIDHETGTRDLRQLGGLYQKMPVTMTLAAIAALSLAGLPPLFGFLAKETLLATAVHPSLPLIVAYGFAGAVVVAAALKVVQAGLLVVDTFFGKVRDAKVFGKAHEAPPAMLAAPMIPAVISLMLGVLPEPEGIATFFGLAAEAAHGAPVEISFALWTGLNIPFALSVVAIGSGLVLFRYRWALRERMAGILPNFTFNKAHEGALALIDSAAFWSTRLQHGRLRIYLGIMLLTMVGLVFTFAGIPLGQMTLSWPSPGAEGVMAILRLVALVTTVGAGLASVLLQRDIFSILAVGILGFGVAVLLILEPAPDVALVQLVVDILLIVILVLALARLPRSQRHRAQDFTFAQSRAGLAWDTIVALGVGVVATIVTLTALTTQPRPSLVSPFFAGNAKPLTGAADIVGAIIVDFRALDTLIEIAVFSMAGLGIYTLLRHSTKKHGDEGQQVDELPVIGRVLPSNGISGLRTSSFVHALAYLALPLSLVIAAIHMMYGHDQPGDGFTAGVIVSLVIGFWYLTFGYYEVRRRLRWLRPTALIAAGLLLVIASATSAAFINGSFFSPVNFGEMIGLPLPDGFYLSTSFLFEVAIGLAVLGSVAQMLNTLSHPITSASMQPVSAEEQEVAEETAVTQQPALPLTENQ